MPGSEGNLASDIDNQDPAAVAAPTTDEPSEPTAPVKEGRKSAESKTAESAASRAVSDSCSSTRSRSWWISSVSCSRIAAGEVPDALDVSTGPLTRFSSPMDLSRSNAKMKSVALEAS